jgi:hypothetical protein
MIYTLTDFTPLLWLQPGRYGAVRLRVHPDTPDYVTMSADAADRCALSAKLSVKPSVKLSVKPSVKLLPITQTNSHITQITQITDETPGRTIEIVCCINL